jgi:hypothetical protein
MVVFRFANPATKFFTLATPEYRFCTLFHPRCPYVSGSQWAPWASSLATSLIATTTCSAQQVVASSDDCRPVSSPSFAPPPRVWLVIFRYMPCGVPSSLGVVTCRVKRGQSSYLLIAWLDVAETHRCMPLTLGFSRLWRKQFPRYVAQSGSASRFSRISQHRSPTVTPVSLRI